MLFCFHLLLDSSTRGSDVDVLVKSEVLDECLMLIKKVVIFLCIWVLLCCHNLLILLDLEFQMGLCIFDSDSF